MSEKNSILVVEDEELLCRSLVEFLNSSSYTATGAGTTEEAEKYLKERFFKLVLTDITLPGKSGSELLAYIKSKYPETQVIVMTAFGSMELAIDMIKKGAYYYLPKPIDHNELQLLIERALRESNQIDEIEFLSSRLSQKEPGTKLIYRSGVMQDIIDKIGKFSRGDAPVLITGENGTGKDLVANLLHQTSTRSKKRFVAVNCASFQETLLESELFGHERGAFTSADRQKKGLLEIADGGTLFLDEVGELPLAIQAKFLRFIEEKSFRRVGGTREIHVDIRILSATNKNLENFIAKKKFRQDLYFRLHVLTINIPPLRERPEDIPELVEHFLNIINKKKGKKIKRISDEAVERLGQYSWPGNVRELNNIVEQAVYLSEGDILTAEDFSIPETPATAENFQSKTAYLSFKEFKEKILSEYEKKYFYCLMKDTGGHIGKAAEKAGIDRKNFTQKLQKYGINKEQFKK